MFKSFSGLGWMLVALLLGACSMSYELLLAKVLSEILGNDVLCQSVTVGTYLLGMGWGAWRASHPRSHEAAKRKIIQLEILLAMVGCLAPMFVILFFTFVQFVFPVAFFLNEGQPLWQLFLLLCMQPLPLLIGFWSGWELPLVIQLSGPTSAARNLAGSFFGALIGSWFVPWSGLVHWTVMQSALLIAVMNWLVAFVLIFVLLEKPLRSLLVVGMVWIFICLTAYGQGPVLQTHLTLYYGNYGLGQWDFESIKQITRLLNIAKPVQRVVSSYQNIDLVDSTFFTDVGRSGAFTMYLNRKPQFSADTFQSYHQSMVYGAINLSAQQLEEAVVLGGGDGLIVSELLRLPSIKKITLVELDPDVLRLARTDPRLLALNRHSLYDPRVNIVVGDAFQFLRQQKVPLRAVFIDFPYPDSFDTTKLFSQEFFTVLQNHLAANGFAIMDAPIWRTLGPVDEPRPWPQDLLQSTLAAAGIHNYLLFGPIEPFLYIPEKSQTKPHFDYSQFPEGLDGRTMVNLTDIDHLTVDTQIRTDYVNSIFKPRRWQ